MFVGHYAASFVAKGVDRALPLWVLILAAQLLDVIWAGFLLLGVEQIRIVPGYTATNALMLMSVPFSHSLSAAAIWALVAVMAYNTFTQYGRARGMAALVGGVVLVHWLFDAVVHPAQLPLYGNRLPVGLGLWRYPLLSTALELALLVGAVVFYLRSARPQSALLRRGLLVLIPILAGVQLAAVMGPPPPSVMVVAVSGLITPLAITAVVFLLERREPRPLT
jgi:hypothetical protein